MAPTRSEADRNPVDHDPDYSPLRSFHERLADTERTVRLVVILLAFNVGLTALAVVSSLVLVLGQAGVSP